ncbi:MAG: hypothetical protein FJ088_08855 [Deltaproteobacteria bacterium]|nr:hypothetical protein [Deltaproteobacteria bacterium]
MSGQKEISLMFSGGVDSTIAAVELAKGWDRIHLVTFRNGYGHYAMERTADRAKELNAMFGGKFVHSVTPAQELFEKIVVDDLKNNYDGYGSAFIWCMGCKLSMHAMNIVYCKRNGIGFASDGSSSDTQEMVEQMLISVSLVKILYEDHGIQYIAPVYDISRDEKRKRLKEMGFRMGIPVRDRYLRIQPSCIPGELYYLPYILFNKGPVHEEKTVAKFIMDKREIVEEYIRIMGRQQTTDNRLQTKD